MTTFCLDYGFQTLQQIASCPNVTCRYFGPPANNGFLQRLGTSVPFRLDLALQNGPKRIIHRIRVWWIREPLCGRFEVRDSRFMRRCRVLLKGPWSATEMFVCPWLQSNLQNTFPIILRIYLDARFDKNDWRWPLCGYSGLKHYLGRVLPPGGQSMTSILLWTVGQVNLSFWEFTNCSIVKIFSEIDHFRPSEATPSLSQVWLVAASVWDRDPFGSYKTWPWDHFSVCGECYDRIFSVLLPFH